MIFDGSSSVYELDLAKLDASKIVIGPTSKRGLAAITIKDEPTGLIVGKKPDDMLSRFQPGKYIFLTKGKSVEKTVKAFHDIAKVCSDTK